VNVVYTENVSCTCVAEQFTIAYVIFMCCDATNDGRNYVVFNSTLLVVSVLFQSQCVI
jgi:hypothetical protein